MNLSIWTLPLQRVSNHLGKSTLQKCRVFFLLCGEAVFSCFLRKRLVATACGGVGEVAVISVIYVICILCI
jgi:hypothetical protein